jgi:molecular chaperone GrpE
MDKINSNNPKKNSEPEESKTEEKTKLETEEQTKLETEEQTKLEQTKLETEEQSKPEEIKGREIEEIILSQKEYQELKEKADKFTESNDKILRLQADFSNIRKRWEKEKQEFIKFANEELLLEILKIVDDFERSLEMSRPKKEEISVLFQGMEMILKNIHELLKKHEVFSMETKGKIFDPNFHEALMQTEKEDVPEKTILEEFQKGYMIQNKVLRVARVQISCKKS